MNRRELFRRLAGVSLVGAVAPEISPTDSHELLIKSVVRDDTLYRTRHHSEFGRVIVVDLNAGNSHRSLLMVFSPSVIPADPRESIILDGHGISPATRKRLADEFLWDEYAWRLGKEGVSTSPKFVFVPARNWTGDPLEYNREIYGYYAEAIERV